MGTYDLFSLTKAVNIKLSSQMDSFSCLVLYINAITSLSCLGSFKSKMTEIMYTLQT